MKCIPKGAIQDRLVLRELSYRRSAVYIASRTFHSISIQYPTGWMGNESSTGSEYHWYEYCTSDSRTKGSLLDVNIPPNSYNDWYLFTKEDDANDYVKGEQS